MPNVQEDKEKNMENCETCRKTKETCPVGKPGVSECRNYEPSTEPSPTKPEPCRKCGNPEGYDTFWREDPPFYACGKCGEREHPEKPEPSQVGPDTVVGGMIPILDLAQKSYHQAIYLKELKPDIQQIILVHASLVSERDALRVERDELKNELYNRNREVVTLQERVKELEKELNKAVKVIDKEWNKNEKL